MSVTMATTFATILLSFLLFLPNVLAFHPGLSNLHYPNQRSPLQNARHYHDNRSKQQLIVPSTPQSVSSSYHRSAQHLRKDKSTDYDIKGPVSELNSRRFFLSTVGIVCITIMGIEPSVAGEVGTKITREVTQSDLGISVRRSVVNGAKLIDKLDGRWEKFSDENNLGKERSKRDSRPKPKEIPDLLPLDVGAARAVLKSCDETFLSMVPPGTDLQAQIQKVNSLVRKTFEKGGVVFQDAEGGNEATMMNTKQFNYYCYIHFKAFCDILIENKISFDRKRFEIELG